MRARVLLVGSGGLDSRFCALVEQDLGGRSARFLVNCPEGTQRLAAEHGARIQTLDAAVLTNSGSLHTASGLPGLVHTRGRELPPLPILANWGSAGPQHGVVQSMFDCELVDVALQPVSGYRSGPVAWASVGPAGRDGLGVLARFENIRGRFRPDLARARGIKPGPDFAALARGERVLAADGSWVCPDDVMEPAVDPGSALLLAPEAGQSRAELAAAAETAAPALMAGLDGPLGLIVAAADPAELPILLGPFIRALPPDTEPLVILCARGDGHPRRDGRAVVCYRAALAAGSKSADQFLLSASGALAQPDCMPDALAAVREAAAGRLLRVVVGHAGLDVAVTGRAGVDGARWEIVSDPGMAEKLPSAHEIAAFEAKHDLSADRSPAPGIAALAAAARAAAPSSALAMLLAPGENVGVVMLGTGAAQPSKYRNVSGSMVVFRRPDGSTGGLLVDCGEATALALTTFFTRAELADLLLSPASTAAQGRQGRTAHVFLTHNHGDHHFGVWGVAQLLAELAAEQGARLELQLAGAERALRFHRATLGELPPPSGPAGVLPPPRISYVHSCHMCAADMRARAGAARRWASLCPPDAVYDELAADADAGHRSAACLAATARAAGMLYALPCDFGFHLSSDAVTAGVLRRTRGLPRTPPRLTVDLPVGVGAARAVPAHHGSHCAAYSFVFEGPDKAWRVAISGDTRPTPEFAAAARHADLIVHEATHTDELVTDAVEKYHSTLSEALAVAERAQPRVLVLTHFSQRFSKFAVTEAGAQWPVVAALDSCVVGVTRGRVAETAARNFAGAGFAQ